MTKLSGGQEGIAGTGNISVLRFNKTGGHWTAAGIQSKLTFPVSYDICNLIAINEFRLLSI